MPTTTLVKTLIKTLRSNLNLLNIIIIIIIILPTTCHATRHSLTLQKDPRSFIGPLGLPYGFVKGGTYEMTIFDFVVERRSRTKKSGKEEVQKEIGSDYDVGFLLKRFHSQSDFARFKERILDDSIVEYDGGDDKDDDGITAFMTKCSFEHFRDFSKKKKKGIVKMIDTDHVSKNGIYTSMNPILGSSTSNQNITIHHKFQKGEEGLYILLYQICPRFASSETLHPPKLNNEKKKNKKAMIQSDLQKQAMIQSDLQTLQSTFELDLHYKNIDHFGRITYLTAGDMPLPLMFAYFTVSYFIMFIIWIKNIHSIRSSSSSSNNKPTIFPIHNLMTLLILTKTLTILIQSLRYHSLHIHGHHHHNSSSLWNILYSILSLARTFLSTLVIILIGSGYSFLKPFLSVREGRLLGVILILQMLNYGIWTVVLGMGDDGVDDEEEGGLMVGERGYEDWVFVFHLVDAVCCVGVLVPIVWMVNGLEVRLGTDDDHDDEEKEEEEEDVELDTDDTFVNNTLPSASSRKQHQQDQQQQKSSNSNNDDDEDYESKKILSKLKLFRSFYLLVICYLYFTRIVVYLFSSILSFRYTWLKDFVVELSTLAFYTVVGILFRPMVENPYLEVKKEDDDDHDDDSDVKGGGMLEMGTI